MVEHQGIPHQESVKGGRDRGEHCFYFTVFINAGIKDLWTALPDDLLVTSELNLMNCSYCLYDCTIVMLVQLLVSLQTVSPAFL